MSRLRGEVVVKLSSHTTFSFYLYLGLLIFVFGCSSADDPYERIVKGTISYPFYKPTRSIGKSGEEKKFVIRTVTGNTEYIVEIPGGGRDYDIEVPIAEIKGDEPKEKIKNPQIGDRELVTNMPKMSLTTQEERAVMDKAFGVGEDGGPRQAPSYLLGLHKINKLYRAGNYEHALIKIVNLQAYYPTSIKLLKMKGTILIKLGNLKLAEKAWVRASELSPQDPVIKKGLKRLRYKIEQDKRLALMQKNNMMKVEGEATSSSNQSMQKNSNKLDQDNSMKDTSSSQKGVM